MNCMSFKTSVLFKVIIAIGLIVLLAFDYTDYVIDKPNTNVLKLVKSVDFSISSEYFDKQSNWICDCEKRVPITINGGATLLTDYQVKLQVPKSPEINSAYSNIQFTSSNQTSVIEHWTQTFNATNGVVWVEIPSIPTTGTTIYMYYGGCGSAGDASNVFEYFNDFTSSAGIVDAGSGDFSTGMYAGLSVLKKENECDPNGAEIALNFSLNDYVLVSKEVRPNDGNSNAGCSLNRYGVENSSYNGYGINRNGHTGSNFAIERRSNARGGNSSSVNLNPIIPRDTFVITELRRCTANNENEGELFNNQGESLAQVTSSITSRNYSGFDRIMVRGGYDFYVDYVVLAKYSCNPPTYSFGSSEVDGPEAICQDVSVSLDARGSITVDPNSVDNNSSDNCDNDLSLSLSKPSFDCSEVGMTIVTLTVTDDEGNTDQCTSTITISDNTSPTISCPSDTTYYVSSGSCTVSGVSIGSATTSDNCGISSVDNDGLATYPLEETTVFWTVEDNSGNTATCTQVIEVVDNIDPIISCPSDTTYNVSSGSCTVSGVSIGSAITSDNCGISSVDNDGLGTYPLEETTVLWTVEDNSGNTATCSQKITVLDKIQPALVCADTLKVNVDGGLCTASSLTLAIPTITDNCTLVDTSNNESAIYPLGITEVTWTAEDNSGNTNTCIQVVEVKDNIAPSITCPTDTTYYVSSVECTVSGVDIGNALTSDNCGVDTVYNDGLTVYPLGETTVTWTVEDENGLSNNCNQKITLLDTIQPVLVCADTLKVNVHGGLCTASGFTLATPTITDNCIVVDTSNNELASYPLGITEVTWAAADNSGNTNTCIQIVEVTDNIVPSITCPSDTTYYVTSVECTVSGVDIGNALTSDNCGVDTVYNDGLTIYPLGETTVLWTLEDDNELSNNCSQKITVLDTIQPVLVCADTLKVNVDGGLCTASGLILSIPTITDNCTLVDTSNNESAIYPLGITEVTWTAEDNSGNTNTCIQVVEVTDNIAPSITCPSDTTYYVTSGECAVSGVDIGNSLTSDNCGVDTVYNDGLTVYPLGEATVMWTVEDDNGLSNNCSQKITVIDTIQPVLVCADTLKVNVDVGLCAASGLTLTIPTITDNCTLVDTSNNAPSTYPLGITEVTWTAEDNSGNSNTCIQVVEVTDNIAPSITCPSDTTYYVSSVSCSISGVDIGNALTSDNCGVDTVYNDGLTVYPLGEITVMWTVEDDNGLSNNCNQKITVLDTIQPVLVCADTLKVNVDVGLCTGSGLTLAIPTITDNCTLVDKSNNALSTYPLGITEVSWTAEDNSGNTNTCIQVVEVTDNIAPSITCPSDTTYYVTSGECAVSGVDIENSLTSDNCGADTVYNDGLTVYPLGETTVTWTVEDDNGLSNNCSQKMHIMV